MTTCEIPHSLTFKIEHRFPYLAMKGLAMRTLLISSLVIATTAAAATVLYSTGSSNRLAVKPIAVPDFNYRFHDRFCRAEYNNPTDRNICMTHATGTALQAPNSAGDDH